MPLTLLSAGSNAHGQLGHSETEDSHTFQPCNFEGFPPGTLPEGTTEIVNLATGANHTIIALRREKVELWACGDGRAGQLGSWPPLGDSERTDVFRRLVLLMDGKEFEGFEVKNVAAGWETTYVVLSPPKVVEQAQNDVVLSMGADDWGDLGVGGKGAGKSKKNVNSEKRAWNRVAYDQVPELEGRRPFRVTQIVAKQRHVLMLLLEVGTGRTWLIGWGAGRHGQISPQHATSSVSSSSRNTLPAIVDRPQVIFNGTSPMLVGSAVGSQHSAVLTSSGDVLGLGSNRKGQLDFSSWKNVQSIDCTWNGTYAILPGSVVVATGSNTHGQLGHLAESPVDSSSAIRGPEFPPEVREMGIRKLACGSEHVLTLWGEMGSSRAREVWAWGWNEHGNLGLGTKEDTHIPVKIFPADISQVPEASLLVDVWGGSGTSWICCSTQENERV